MYVFLLGLHNILRWVVVLAAIYVLYRSYSGLFGRRAYTEADASSARWFTISMDVQLLVGLLLYFVFSPLTREAMRDFGAAMSNTVLRFFAVEHLLMMVVAVVLAHVGSAQVKRLTEDRAKFMRSAIWFTLSILLVLASIPWNTRPILPGM